MGGPVVDEAGPTTPPLNATDSPSTPCATMGRYFPPADPRISGMTRSYEGSRNVGISRGKGGDSSVVSRPRFTAPDEHARRDASRTGPTTRADDPCDGALWLGCRHKVSTGRHKRGRQT